MPYLKIFYDKDYKEELAKFDLTPILEFSHPEILNEKYWKYENDNYKVDEYTLIEYGEYILKLVESYKEHFPQINWLQIFMIKKPADFNMKYFFLLLMNLKYQHLLEYINTYLEKLYLTEVDIDNERIDDEDHITNEYHAFRLLLVDYSLELFNHINNPKYYSEKLNDYINKEYLDEIKSFGYFNLKYGDSGRYGLWTKN